MSWQRLGLGLAAAAALPACSVLLGIAELTPANGPADGAPGSDAVADDGAASREGGSDGATVAPDATADGGRCQSWTLSFEDGAIPTKAVQQWGALSVADDAGVDGSRALRALVNQLPSASWAYVERGLGSLDGGAWGEVGVPWRRVDTVAVRGSLRFVRMAPSSTAIVATLFAGAGAEGSDFSLLVQSSDAGLRSFSARVRPSVSALPGWRSATGGSAASNGWQTFELVYGRATDGGVDRASFTGGNTSIDVSGLAPFAAADDAATNAAAAVNFGIGYAAGGTGTTEVLFDDVSVEVCLLP